ncbi:hypothetical protein IGJ39_002073 [Enterococcus sp. AZ140]|uniref:response regulator n=1 Tax=Enterococcus sp. AZ140 TaxID=2774731 RepID=UPI003F296F12
MTNILLVDDSALITSGLKIILESTNDFQVVGICHDGRSAIAFCEKNQVDLVLMDVRMPGMDGVTATQQITEVYQIPVIILTTFDEDRYIEEGIRNGASGYLLKTTPPEAVIQAIKSVLQGQTILSKEILVKATQQLGNKNDQEADLSLLTEREQEIAYLVAKGMTNKVIAQTLFLSEGTVHNNLSMILKKLNLDHRTQLAIYVLTGEVMT